jgi:hypothetical protein
MVSYLLDRLALNEAEDPVSPHLFLMNTVLGGITELMLKNPVLLREVIPKDELTQKKQINSIGD